MPVQLADEEGSDAERVLFPFARELRDNDRLIGEVDDHLRRLAAREKDRAVAALLLRHRLWQL